MIITIILDYSTNWIGGGLRKNLGWRTKKDRMNRIDGDGQDEGFEQMKCKDDGRGDAKEKTSRKGKINLK